MSAAIEWPDVGDITLELDELPGGTEGGEANPPPSTDPPAEPPTDGVAPPAAPPAEAPIDWRARYEELRAAGQRAATGVTAERQRYESTLAEREGALAAERERAAALQREQDEATRRWIASLANEPQRQAEMQLQFERELWERERSAERSAIEAERATVARERSAIEQAQRRREDEQYRAELGALPAGFVREYAGQLGLGEADIADFLAEAEGPVLRRALAGLPREQAEAALWEFGQGLTARMERRRDEAAERNRQQAAASRGAGEPRPGAGAAGRRTFTNLDDALADIVANVRL